MIRGAAAAGLGIDQHYSERHSMATAPKFCCLQHLLALHQRGRVGSRPRLDKGVFVHPHTHAGHPSVLVCSEPCTVAEPSTIGLVGQPSNVSAASCGTVSEHKKKLVCSRSWSCQAKSVTTTWTPSRPTAQSSILRVQETRP